MMRIKKPCSILIDVADPLLWEVVQRNALKDLVKKSFGNSTIYVPSGIMESVVDAIRMLKSVDPDLYVELASLRLRLFYSDVPVYESTFSGRFRLEKWMIENGGYSLVFGIVLAIMHRKSLLNATFADRLLSNKEEWQLLAHDQLIDWMKRRGFREEDIKYAENCWYYYKGLERADG